MMKLRRRPVSSVMNSINAASTILTITTAMVNRMALCFCTAMSRLTFFFNTNTKKNTHSVAADKATLTARCTACMAFAGRSSPIPVTVAKKLYISPGSWCRVWPPATQNKNSHSVILRQNSTLSPGSRASMVYMNEVYNTLAR